MIALWTIVVVCTYVSTCFPGGAHIVYAYIHDASREFQSFKECRDLVIQLKRAEFGVLYHCQWEDL